MAESIKRVHYFDHQFLRENDFTKEQEYHIGMRQRHNRLLHTWGIADGLGLSYMVGASRGTVSEGIAFDGQGRQIVLAEDTPTQDLSGSASKALFVTISYGEEQTDSSDEMGVPGNTRWTEKAVIEVAENAPSDPSQKLILGRLIVGSDGKISAKDEGVGQNRRRIAGAMGGELEARSLTLTDPNIDKTLWTRLNLSGPGQTSLTGSLSIGAIGSTGGNLQVNGSGSFGGNVGIGTTSPENSEGWDKVLDVFGGTATKLSVRTRNIDARLLAHDSGWGGAPAGMIIETKTNHPLSLGTNAGVRLTIAGGGNVGIGTTTPSHKFHVVAADAVGLFESSGSQACLRLSTNEGLNNRVEITNRPGGRLSLWTVGGGDVFNIMKDGKVGIGTTSPQSPLHVANSMAVGPFGLPHYPGRLMVTGSSAELGFTKRSLGAWPVDPMPGDRFVWYNPDGKACLWTEKVGDVLSVTSAGALWAKGGKGGYVMDQFVNNIGDTLEQGDLVVISGDQPSHYYGVNDNIPVPEVDLAQRAYDTRVCGIVCELHGELASANSKDKNPGTKPKKKTPEKGVKGQGADETAKPREFTVEELSKMDHTKVGMAQIGSMVTLGAFAHCKVDADIAPIQLGDLLTTSPTKGHAQKVLSPEKAIGAIIGKALGSLKKGKGKIPVLVMLQ